MKRSKPLKADPERTRAWQQRSREKAAGNAWERAMGREGMASASLRRKTPLLRAGKVKGSAAAAGPPALPPVRFKAKRPARSQWCARCAAEGRRRRASSWHHFLPQQHIRVYVRGLRLSADTSRAILRKLLADERNLWPLCAACHEAHESPGVTTRRISGEEVTYSARIFALELGPEWAAKLAHLYPGGQRA